MRAHLTTTALLSIVAIVVVAMVLFAHPLSRVKATATDNVSGYAWSEFVGWVSMNDLTYGVDVAADGTISGYAWSENVGWVSFEPADVAGCPIAPCEPALDHITGAVTGWARVLAPVAAGGNAGDWDGWISLSGPGYGVTVSGCNWLGSAWGYQLLGWLNFGGAGGTVIGVDDACVVAPANLTPYVSFTPSATFDPATGNYDYVDITYVIENNDLGDAAPSVTTLEYDGAVVATTNEPLLTSGGTINHTHRVFDVPFIGLTATVTVDTTNTVIESNEGDNVRVLTAALPVPDPGLSIDAVPALVRYGAEGTLNWNLIAYFGLECSVEGPGINPTITFIPDATSLSGTITTDPLVSKGIYIMECVEPITGTVFSADTFIEVVPRIQEN